MHLHAVSVSEEDLSAIEEICGLIPYFVLTFVQLHKADADILRLTVEREEFGLADSVQRWVGRLLENLGKDELFVLEHLSLCDEPFDRDLIPWIIHRTGLGLRSAELIENLTRPFLLRRRLKISWKLQEPLIEGLRERIDASRRSEMYTTIGDFYFRNWQDRPIPRTSLTYDELITLSRACSFFQKGKHRFLTKRKIIDNIGGALRHHGLHRLLILLLTVEVRNNPRRNPWWDIRLAQAHTALGEVAKSFAILEPLIITVLFSTESRSDLRLTFIRTFADLLIYLDMNDSAEAILENALRIFDISTLPWNVLSHTKSILSWAYIKNGRIDDALKINLALSKDAEQVGDKVGLAVAKTRIGFGFSMKGDFMVAATELEEARRIFRTTDRRGLGWASMHLAYAYSRMNRREPMEEVLFEALSINSEHGFCGEDYSWMCEYFCTIIENEELRTSLDAERVRLVEIEKMRTLEDTQIKITEALKDILLMVPGSEGSSKDNKYMEHRAIADADARKMSSELYRTFVRAAVKNDPVGAVETLFVDHSPQRIFSTPLFSKILTEAAKKKPQLAAKYIAPHGGLIEGASDSIRLHFARYFQQVGDTSMALELLRLVGNQDSFYFHNVTANCYAKADFERCEYHNKLALELAYRPQQKTRILTNMAMTIHQHRRRMEFPRAKSLCEEALALRYSPRFYWPSDLLVALEIETCEWEKIGETLAQLRKRLNLGSRAIKRALQQVQDQARRREALQLQP